MRLLTERLTMKEYLGSVDAKLPDYGAKIRSTFGDAVGDDATFMRRAFEPTDIQFAEGETAIIGTITSLERDWYNEVVLPEGMNKSAYNGVVLYNHNYDIVAIPHARNMWLKPTVDKASIVAKTAYLTKLSELGGQVYEYRKAKYPMGQSIGFMPIEWKSKRDDDWEKEYQKWVARYTDYSLSRGVKESKIDTSEPNLIYTKWALLEYSDVFVPANPDASPIAVSNGLVLEGDEMKWVDPDSMSDPEPVIGDDKDIAELRRNVAHLEAEIADLRGQIIPDSTEELYDEYAGALKEAVSGLTRE